MEEAFTAAVCREMDMAAGDPFPAFDTLYLGGGTPTVMTEGRLARVIRTALAAFSFTGTPEVTVEANPGTVTRAALDDLRRAGANRLNVGIQSFDDDNLRFLGRIHSAAEGAEALRQARQAGFENIGIDLIYGLPGQQPAQWARDLERAVSFSPEHLSCYMLTVEPGTPLARDIAAGRVPPPDDGAVADLYSATSERLTAGGYIHYEISNFARTAAFRSRHNRKYWSFAPVLGLGPAAHSFLPGPARRWWNRRGLSAYLKDIENWNRPVDGQETLTPEQCMTEAIYLGLRRAEGVDPAVFEHRFGLSFEARFGDLIRELTADGLLWRSGRAWAPTPLGMRFADGLAQRFIET